MPLTTKELERFPESVRDWDEIKNSDSIEVVWDRFSHMRSKLGTAMFAPGDDAGTDTLLAFDNKAVELSKERLMLRPDLEDEEQRNALYTQLGRPAEATGYELAEVEGSDYSAERKKFITELAHKVGLTQKQLKELDGELRSNEVVVYGSKLRAHDDKLKELKIDWGLAFDDRVHIAKKVALKFFPDLGEDHNFTASELNSFHMIGKQLGGNSREFHDQNHEEEHGVTPSEARMKINEIRGNSEHPYFDHNKPGYKEARSMMRSLYKQANSIPA